MRASHSSAMERVRDAAQVDLAAVHKLLRVSDEASVQATYRSHGPDRACTGRLLSD